MEDGKREVSPIFDKKGNLRIIFLSLPQLFMSAALELAPRHADPPTHGRLEILPQPIQRGVIFAADWLSGRANSLHDYFFSKEQPPGITTALLDKIRRDQPTGSAFLYGTIKPFLVSLGSNPITDDLCQRAVNLTHDWCFHDPSEMAGRKIRGLFEALATYPLGHASFGNLSQERAKPERSRGLNANILFSHLFTPQSFGETLIQAHATAPAEITPEYSSRIINLSHAFAQALERSDDPTRIFDLSNTSWIIDSVNWARDINQPYLTTQASRTTLSEIALLIAGNYDKLLGGINTPVYLDALHSRNDVVRGNAIFELRTSIGGNRIGPGCKDRHFLTDALSSTPLDEEAHFFWQSLESLLGGREDPEVLNILAGRIAGDGNFDHHHESTGYLCGTINTILDAMSLGQSLKENEQFTRIISPKRAVSIVLNILRIYQEKTSAKDPLHWPTRARIRHLATTLLLVDDNYQEAAYQKWTTPDQLVPSVIDGVSDAEQTWVQSYYSSGYEDLGRLRQFISKYNAATLRIQSTS